jgi:phage-related baseplate assembly protein
MSFTPINLAALPDPQVVEQIDYERLLLERKAYAVSLWPADQQAEIATRLALDSDPISKLLQENTYREMLWRQRVNEAALATLLAKARATDLDQVAANFNVQRLVVTPATPKTEAVLESDEALRERAQMAFEGLSTAGPRNSYIFHARSASGLVADATAESPSPAVVVVTVQALLGDGSASPAVLEAVRAYVSDDDRRPVADRLTVQSAQVLPYVVSAVLHLSTSGPEVEPIRQAALNSLTALVTQRRRLGIQVPASALYAALHVEGVRRVELQNWQDLTPTNAQAAYCTGITLNVAGPA